MIDTYNTNWIMLCLLIFVQRSPYLESALNTISMGLHMCISNDLFHFVKLCSTKNKCEVVQRLDCSHSKEVLVLEH